MGNEYNAVKIMKMFTSCSNLDYIAKKRRNMFQLRVRKEIEQFKIIELIESIASNKDHALSINILENIMWKLEQTISGLKSKAENEKEWSQNR